MRFEDGCLVTRFVDGDVGHPDPAEAGRLLRRLHAGPPISARFDSFRVVEVYAKTARERGVELPPFYDDAIEMAGRIEAGAPEPPCDMSQRPARRQLHRRRRADVDRRLGVRGDGRSLLRPRELRREQRARRRRHAAVHGRVRRARPRRADAHALHVRLPRGDVGRRPARRSRSSTSTTPHMRNEHAARLERTAAEPRFREALAR